NILKGLDFEEAVLSWGGAAFLWWGRDSFVVRHERLAWRSPLLVLCTSFVGILVATAGLVWVGSGERADRIQVLINTLDLSGWTQTTVVFRDDLTWVPVTIGLAGLVSIIAAGYVFFRPLPAPDQLPDGAAHETACGLVRAHGRDTLDFFKLRRDVHYFFGSDG